MRHTILCLFILFSGVLFADEAPRVLVSAMGKDGTLLRRGLGFFFDESTVVCAYSNVKDAYSIQVQLDGSKAYTNRVLSYSDLLDLAVLKAEEEMAEAVTPLTFVAPAIGETVNFFVKEGEKWGVKSTSISDFTDTGKGHDTIELRDVKLSGFMASPLLNSDQKVVGWLNTATSAIPIGTIARFVGKNSSVSLSEIDVMKKFWPFRKMEVKAAAGVQPQLSEMKRIHLTTPFSFQVDFPKNWKYQNVSFPGRYLLRAADEEFGMSAELRIMPAQSDDLMTGLERIDTLIFSGMWRSDLIPFSVDHFTGLKATYEDLDPDVPYLLAAFLSMSKGNFYILSLSYPPQFAEQAESLMDQIVCSFHLP